MISISYIYIYRRSLQAQCVGGTQVSPWAESKKKEDKIDGLSL